MKKKVSLALVLAFLHESFLSPWLLLPDRPWLGFGSSLASPSPRGSNASLYSQNNRLPLLLSGSPSPFLSLAMVSSGHGSLAKLQNPFVLRVGQVMTGFGLGCGLGVGVGVPIPMDIPGVAQVMSAANGMTRQIGGGRQLQGLIKRVGIKNLEAGIGCGVGLGHGFGIGLALKPGVAQQILHMLQEGCATVLNKIRPQHHGEPAPHAAPGNHSDPTLQEAYASPFTTSALSQLASTPSTIHSETEVEKLRTQNGILRTLLRHQEKIEDLEQENAMLREQLNINGITRSQSSSRGLQSRETSTQCFDCRRLSRRRN